MKYTKDMDPIEFLRADNERINAINEEYLRQLDRSIHTFAVAATAIAGATTMGLMYAGTGSLSQSFAVASAVTGLTGGVAYVSNKVAGYIL